MSENLPTKYPFIAYVRMLKKYMLITSFVKLNGYIHWHQCTGYSLCSADLCDINLFIDKNILYFDDNIPIKLLKS